MYEYLKQWPKDREMGWSDEIHGVCHDAGNWFFTQNGNLWKFPLKHNINETCKKENRSKGIYKNSYKYRLGDCDCYGEYVFVPVTGDGAPYIAVFNASDLSFVTKQRITRFDSNFTSIHWCAINPSDGRLYTSDRHLGNDLKSDTTPIIVYNIDFNKIRARQSDFLQYSTFILIYNASGKRMTREYMQGGCFDGKNHLHITNGDYTIKGGDHNYANDRGGISVFTIPSISQSSPAKFYQAKRIASSNQSSGFRYQFNGTGEEPSGITYWDLSGKSVPGELCGCLHAIMSDNCGTGDDDFFFKHYKQTSYRDSYISFSARTVTKMGVIITTDRSDGSVLTYDEHRRRVKNQEMVSGLFKNRNIDYVVIENQSITAVKNMITDVFSRSDSNDWNYIYINCHGGNGTVSLGYNAKYSTSFSELHNLFAKISGKRIILLDSCHSGSASDLNDTNSFIICSAYADENAKGDSVFGNWATRYWVCGAGYDFLPGAEDDMEADSNKDNRVTIKELLDYTNKKLKAYSRAQSCVMYSNNPSEVIFV